MRVLIVSSEFPPGPGGIGRHAHALADAFTGHGWSVSAYVRQDYAGPEEIDAFNRAQGFRVVRARSGEARPWTAFRDFRELDRLIDATTPDVILATGRWAVWIAAARARRAVIPWLAIGHGTEFRLGHCVSRRLTRWAFERADLVVCVSEHTRRVMQAAGFRVRASRVIPNGADPERFRPLSEEAVAAARRELGVEGRRVVLTVGRVSPRKGQDVVARSLAALGPEFDDVVYLLVGLPADRAIVDAAAREAGVADRVRLLGVVDDEKLVEVINSAHVFAMTSRTTEEGDLEGYGIAVVEAALCGVPAVVTRDSGLVEAIEEGATGLAVPPDDPASTARAIATLLADEELRERMGERARARALAEQTWDRRAGEFRAAIVEVAARKSGAVPL